LSLLFSESRAALFPLGTVLFPGCTLPLQIFEQRYLRLIKTCLQDNHGFVVILISAGKEVGDTPETYSIGTYVEVVDWETLENGLLGVTIQAKHRVRITHPSAQDDGLMTGEMETLDTPDTDPALADENITDLIDTLKLLEQHPYIDKQITETDYASTKDVCNKLSQLLPVDTLIKQSLLEINNTSERISKLRGLVHQLQQ
jgi:Lon protease-like protein